MSCTSRTTKLATLNVHTTVTGVLLLNYYLLHAGTSPPYQVLAYSLYQYIPARCRVSVLYAEKYIQVTCKPQHCMTTISVLYRHNCFLLFFFLFFILVPFSDHTVTIIQTVLILERLLTLFVMTSTTPIIILLDELLLCRDI